MKTRNEVKNNALRVEVENYIILHKDEILYPLFIYDSGWAVYIWRTASGALEHCAHPKNQTQMGVEYIAHVSDCGWEDEQFDAESDNTDFLDWLSDYMPFPSCLEGKVTIYED
jgi:hypothetical protein